MKTEFEGKQYTMSKDGDKIVLTPVEPPKPARLEFPWAGAVTVAGYGLRSKRAGEIAESRLDSCMRQIQAGLEADPDAGGFVESVRDWSFFFDSDNGKWRPVRYFSTTSCPIYVHTLVQAEAAVELLNREGVKP